MALMLEGKKAVVEEVASIAKTAHSIVAAEYRGLTVAEMTQLRVQARSNGVALRVTRNTLARRALKDTEFDCMGEKLVGPLVLAFSQEDPGSAARVLKDYAKTNDKLVIRMASVGGELLDASQVDKLAKLPTRDGAISILMSVMLAPITKFVRTMNEPHAKLARTVAAIRDQKQAA